MNSMRPQGKLLALAITAVLLLAGVRNTALASPPPAPLLYEEPVYLSGSIYAQPGGTNNLLFRFVRTATRAGNTLNVQRDFLYPDGKLAAREKVTYEGDSLTSFALEETQIKADGSAAVRKNTSNKPVLAFEYRKEGDSKPKTSTETLAPITLVSDMIATYLGKNFQALLRGEKLKTRYIAIPRCETVGFTFVKDSETNRAGTNLVVIRMEATSPFISALVDPLFFTFEKSPPHRILEYAGRTTPKLRSGNKWKDLDALTIFDWSTNSPPQ